MPTIAEAAAAALAAAQAAEAARLEEQRTIQATAARARVSTVLAPLDGGTLDTACVDLAGGLTVLTDGDVCIGHTRDQRLFLVRDDAGWTRLAGPLGSLADLGQALAARGAGVSA